MRIEPMNIPSEAELIAQVDELITPELADRQAEIICGWLDMTADTDDRVKSEIMETLRRRIFTKTSKFEEAYQAFSGSRQLPLPAGTIEVGTHQ
jgi:malate synthase